MLSLPPGIQVFMAVGAVDMRKSFNGLSAAVETVFERNVLDGHLFLFLNRKRDRIKILFWDVDGFCIWYKRLEVGSFQMPVATQGDQSIELNCRQLNQVLNGLDLRNGRRRRRYRRVS